MSESPPTTGPTFPDSEPIGTLRDIYVFDTDERDWQRVLDFLHRSPLVRRFTVDGVEAPLPGRMSDVRALQERSAVALTIDPSGMRLGCYFFVPAEIEFDFDPRDVRSPALSERVDGFVQTLSDLLGKPAVITDENDPDTPLHRFIPRVSASHVAL